MSLFKKTTAVLCLAAVAGTCFAGYSPAYVNENDTAFAAVDDSGDDWLHTKGSRIYDMNGNEVWLTGANWFGLNCSENAPHGLYARDVDDMLQSIADHGINIIRFPISTELLLSWMDGEPLPVSSVQASYNPPKDEVGEDGTVTPAGKYGDINRDFCEADGKTLKNSMEIFDIIMQKMKKYGIKALVDVHSPASHNSGHNYNLWYYEPTAEDCDGMATGHFSGKEITWDNWKDSITWLAEKYANDDTILAYDLKNEPHGKRGYDGSSCPANMAKWDDSTDKNNWKYSSEECAKSILKVNPHALILIEGIEQSPRFDRNATWNTADVFQPKAGEEKWYGAWWGGNLRGVKDLPVLPESGQIVYSPHDYGPSVYAQSWFDKDFSTETLLDDYWRDTWAYINSDEIAPLLIG
ncbi:MAG: cellulase family glycosylhydrolase, partial [Oscillospiraceae bacterium]|nr:cellulase family glycosylhydrolase [Oscillospiraceae bacterium]